MKIREREPKTHRRASNLLRPSAQRVEPARSRQARKTKAVLEDDNSLSDRGENDEGGEGAESNFGSASEAGDKNVLERVSQSIAGCNTPVPNSAKNAETSCI